MLEKRLLLKITLLFVLSLHAMGAFAGVYKWVDENGHVQYGDRPPPAVEESAEVTIRDQGSAPPPPPQEVDRKQARDRLLEQYQREREEKKEATAKKRKQKEIQKKRCAYARKTLTEYLEHGLLYERLANQERRYLTDQERDAEIAKARADVKKWCK